MFEEDTMFKFKKLTAIALVAVAAMGLLAGCGSEKSKMTQEAGVLRVGSETTFPPFEFVGSTHLQFHCTDCFYLEIQVWDRLKLDISNKSRI